MFTVNIKGRRNPKNIELVKLDLIFYKRGYARVSKVLRITGLYREWDRKSQSFTGTDAAEKEQAAPTGKTQISEDRGEMGVSGQRLDSC